MGMINKTGRQYTLHTGPSMPEAEAANMLLAMHPGSEIHRAL